MYNTIVVEIREVCSSYQQPHQLRAFQTVLQASSVHPWAVIHTTVHSIPCINKCKNPRSEGWKIKIDQSVTYSEEFSTMLFRTQVSLYLYISRRWLYFSSLPHLDENGRVFDRGGLSSCSGASLFSMLFLPLNGTVSVFSDIRFCRGLLSCKSSHLHVQLLWWCICRQ